MRVAVLVPRRAGDPYRDGVWAWLRQRWARELPSWRVHEGHHDAGPFNRSAAVNRAAAAAGSFDVAVIADADSFCGTEQLDAAVRRAAKTGRMTLAYDQFMYLSRDGSEQIMSGYEGAWEPFVEFTMTGTCSSMVVVPRPLWDRVGGFDEGFKGWGMEDVAFSLACQTFGGGLERIAGPVWHLFHTPSAENDRGPQWQSNLARMKQYEACHYDPALMLELFAQLALA